MKKMISIILILLTLCGCADTVSNSNSYMEEVKDLVYTEAFGVLNLQRCVNKLYFKSSSSWQFMDTKLYNNETSKYEYWKVSYITDYNLRILYGFVNDENKKAHSSLTITDGIDEFVELLKEDGVAYSFVDDVVIDEGKYGCLFDIGTNDGISKRVFYLSDNGGYYIVELQNGSNLIPSAALDFFYNYVQSFTFITE